MGAGQRHRGLGPELHETQHNLVDDVGETFSSHHETILEATYKVQVKDWFTLQPDLQYIFNPGACENLPNAFVAGVRFNITF